MRERKGKVHGSIRTIPSKKAPSYKKAPPLVSAIFSTRGGAFLLVRKFRSVFWAFFLTAAKRRPLTSKKAPPLVSAIFSTTGGLSYWE